MLDSSIKNYIRATSLFLRRNATMDGSKFKLVKSMFALTAGKCTGPQS